MSHSQQQNPHIAQPPRAPQPVPASQHIGDRFGARLRFLRKSRGFTQAGLAQHLGIDRSFISDVERGRKNLSLSYLETIALGFNMSLSMLVAEL